MQAAHEAGIVHRDIKPSNLLIDEQKKLWVTDFGLARVEHDLSLTRTGDLVGTLRYMSPEQAAGNALLVDHRADVYSLGATLYELATLQPAYGSEQGAALLRKMETCSPLLPRSIRSAIPRPLESIIVNAMARERDQRYATATELAADLQRFLQGEPVHARPPSLLECGQRCRPQQARWLLLLLLLWSVGGLGYVVRSQGSIAAPASAAPDEQPIALLFENSASSSWFGPPGYLRVFALNCAACSYVIIFRLEALEKWVQARRSRAAAPRLPGAAPRYNAGDSKAESVTASG